MDKYKVFEKLVYQLIGENKMILEKITQVLETKPTRILDIKITNAKSFEASNNMFSINCGIQSISNLYYLCKRYCKELDMKYKMTIEEKFSDWGNSKNIYSNIRVYEETSIDPIPSCILESAHFLDQTALTEVDTLIIYSFAFALYHEIGHLVYDNVDSLPINKEYFADRFAFEVCKYMCDNATCKEESNVRFIGSYIGLSQWLQIGDYEGEKKDQTHPFTIERMFLLLDYWNLADDCCFWKYGYDDSMAWIKKNCVPITWDISESKSYKEKFSIISKHFTK